MPTRLRAFGPSAGHTAIRVDGCSAHGPEDADARLNRFAVEPYGGIGVRTISFEPG